MGIEGRQLTAAVNCLDDFPAVPDQKAMSSLDPQALIQIALQLRSDYRAQEWAESAREAVLKGVERNMAPQVDLKVKAGYVGYEDGSGVSAFQRSFDENVPGASVSMQLTASFPFSNSAMKGRMIQARSQRDQSRWQKEKLDRQIRSDLMTAWAQLKSRMAVLEEAAQARENYEASLASEKKKYLLGMSTLIDVLTVENQVTQAQLNAVAAQTDVAVALVRLRFESGTLLSEEGEWITVRAEDLIRLPATPVQPVDRLRGRAPAEEGGTHGE
jgi:outer membrane protein TolC